MAACGGGGGGSSGSTSKTITSPGDGAQLSQALTNLFNKVGGNNPPPGKAATSTSANCSGGGTVSTTGDPNNTAYAFDGAFDFSNCVETDSNNDQITLNGPVVLKCTDPNQTSSSCNFNDTDTTLGQTSSPLSAEIKNSPIDVLGQFFQFLLSLTDSGDQQHDNASITGRIVVTDLGPTNCGTFDFTVATKSPLVVSQSDLSQISGGEITLTAADGSSADVMFSPSGETVTVNGVSQTYSAQNPPPIFCGGV